MTRRLKIILSTTALAAMAMILAGCMQLNMGLTVNSDDTVSGELLLTAERTLLTNGGKTVEQGFADLRQNIPAMPPGDESVYNTDPKYYGVRIKYDRTPLSQFNSESIKLVKNNGTYRFTLPLDPKLYGAKFASSNPQQQQTFMKLMSFEIQVTFPGRILDSNGTEIGQTVSWKVDANQDKPADLHATAEAPDNTPPSAGTSVAPSASAAAAGGGSGGFPWLLVVGGVVLLAIVAAVVLFLIRKPKAPVAPEPEATPATPTAP
ncbi:LppM family (lipo)protein [Hamadaea tsunoensis]|uniref:LppM family (lipo)protein n=1 Tax=Hamadaea tsunoensis TaxID=53368 RepID=UPI0004061238|nr:DUF3153 domain-containing protein [Hamadaea tsunoensis]